MMQEMYKLLMLILTATGETSLMVLFSAVFSLVLGLPLGILLCISDPAAGIKPKSALYHVLSRIVNVRADLEN